MAHNTWRKRRRWLIVTLGLFAACAWSCWAVLHRGVDLRLVGDWSKDDLSGSYQWRFLADGTCVSREKVMVVSGQPLRRRWMVESNHLLISQTPTRFDGHWSNRLKIELQFAWTRLNERENAYRRYRINEATADTLELQSSESDKIDRYHRMTGNDRRFREFA